VSILFVPDIAADTAGEIMAQSIRTPVAVALAGAACTSSSAVLMSLAGSSAGATALYRCLFALPLLGLLTVVQRRRGGAGMPRRARWEARLSGIFFAGALIFWSPAITAIGAGLSSVLTNLQVLMIPPLAWLLLRERPRRSVLVALPVILGGVALIAGLLGAHSFGADPLAGVGYGVAVSASYSGFILLLQHATRPVPGETRPTPIAQPLYEATLGAAVAAAVFAFGFGDYRLGPAWPALGWLALLALCSQVVGWLLITKAMPSLPAGLVAALLLVQPAGAVALGAVALGEQPSGQQLAGVALVLLGVFLAAGEAIALPRLRGRRRAAAARPAPAVLAAAVAEPVSD
jgi:drug/metabolite transporter (DMT)-like permease